MLDTDGIRLLPNGRQEHFFKAYNKRFIRLMPTLSDNIESNLD